MSKLDHMLEQQQRLMLKRYWNRNGFDKITPSPIKYEPPKKRETHIVTVQDMEEAAWAIEETTRRHVKRSDLQLTPELVSEEVKDRYREQIRQRMISNARAGRVLK